MYCFPQKTKNPNAGESAESLKMFFDINILKLDSVNIISTGIQVQKTKMSSLHAFNILDSILEPSNDSHTLWDIFFYFKM